MDIERISETLLDRYQNGGLSRRHFLSGIASLALANGVVASGLTALARPARAAGGSIRFDGFGGFSQGAFSKVVLEPYAKEFGVAVTQGSYSNPDMFLAQIQAEGVQNYNVFWAAQELSPIKIARRGWNAEIEAAKIPRLASIPDKLLDINRAQGGGKLISVPYCLSGGSIIYNTKMISPDEMAAKGFGILLDPKYKGNLSGFENWQYRLYYAAIQSGQDPNNIIDMNAVWDKVRESKRNVLKYYTSGAEQSSLLTSGNVVAADGWFVQLYNLRKRGEPLAGWPAQGSYTQFGALVALKGTSMQAFYEMVDVLLRPEVSFALALETGNLPLLDPAKHSFPAEIQSIPGYDPTGKFEGYRRFDPVLWDQNSDAWQREYTRIMARA